MTLDVLLFQETGSWVAQCLQYDIAAPGRKIDDAIYELQRIICGQIVVRKELNLPSIEQGLPRAPEIYWRLYHQAKKKPVDRGPQAPHGKPGGMKTFSLYSPYRQKTITLRVHYA